MFSVALKIVSARYATAANLISSDIDVFSKQSRIRKQILRE
jgi:hypothetical protein